LALGSFYPLSAIPGMRRQSILRTLLFVIFFSIGAAALSGSILCGDLLEYYTNRHLLSCGKESLNRLESLNDDYDALLEQVQKDPNLIKRIAPVTLGNDRPDQNTYYPEVAPEQLDAARKALTEEPGGRAARPAIPEWLKRCSQPHRRITLFLAGALLILVSFIWFGAGEATDRKA